jgi:hypothetical protein
MFSNPKRRIVIVLWTVAVAAAALAWFAVDQE